jgi:hypothetical protein
MWRVVSWLWRNAAPSGETICSAFAARGRLLTAAHCVHRDPVSFVRQAPITFGAEYASVVRVDHSQDWAVLQLSVELPELVIAAPHPGEVSTQAARDDWAVAFGTLLESYYAGTAPRWSAALDVEPGWSGSPVLQEGRVIGILQGCRGAEWPRKACARPGFVTFFPAASVPL